MLDLAREMLALSRAGLERRNLRGANTRTEACYLDPLDDLVARGKTQADDLLALYHGAWGGSVAPVFKALAY